MDFAFDLTNNFVLGLICGSVFGIIFVIVKHYYNKNKINKYQNGVEFINKFLSFNRDPKFAQSVIDGKPDFSSIVDTMGTTLDDMIEDKDKVNKMKEALHITKSIVDVVFNFSKNN